MVVGRQYMGIEKIQDFTDLVAWQKAHKLALVLSKMTKTFPKEELYALTSQIRRAASSFTSNIAEGFGRKTAKDKIHFYTMSSASVYELRNQIILAGDLGYVTGDQQLSTTTQAVSVQKLLAALIKSIEGKL